MDEVRVEPFEEFAAFFNRFMIAEGISKFADIPKPHLVVIERTARELGVIFHRDGSLELIRQ